MEEQRLKHQNLRLQADLERVETENKLTEIKEQFAMKTRNLKEEEARRSANEAHKQVQRITLFCAFLSSFSLEINA